MVAKDDILMEITPQVLLKAYTCGIFPMAESASDPSLFWIEPEIRGIIPLNNFKTSKSLRKVIRQNRFEIRIDNDFDAVISHCAEATPNRPSTWINKRIRHLYGELFDMGFCHTVECWQDNKLVGGLYGIHIGAAFFGESMFSRVSNASKVTMAHLVHRMQFGKFLLLDTQFTTEHLKSLGALDVDREDYEVLLNNALDYEADFFPENYPKTSGVDGTYLLQSLSQTS
jgi:leucyl/phenylalanyl-tRNA--protein transferase